MANTSNLDLVKPAGTDHALISVINSNMDKVDAYAGKVNTSLAGVEDGLAIVATGNTHAAITAGQFVYVKEHNTLPEGLYTASSNIAANATLSTTNLTADSKGGLNALSDQIVTLNSNISALDSGKINVISKKTGSGRTFTIIFTDVAYAFMFGRFGYDSSLLTCAIIYHPAADTVYIKCLGDESATATCSGHVVTITMTNSYASALIISNEGIS